MQSPLPASEQEFVRRLEEGRARLTLITQEVARLAGAILLERLDEIGGLCEHLRPFQLVMR